MKNTPSQMISRWFEIQSFVEKRDHPLSISETVLFKLIPNAAEFYVKTGSWDPIFLNHELLKKTPAEIMIKPYMNGPLNRYIKIMYSYLSKRRSDPDKYWTISKLLLTKSFIFCLSSLHAVEPNWYKDKSLMHIRKTWQEYRNIRTAVLSGKTPEISIRRLYIPKGNGKFRPLGIPSLAWRMYLHTYNQLIVLFLHDHLSPNQHGFIPHRGTRTAWLQISQSVLPSNWVYEFDIKQFFDSVSQPALESILIKHHMPKHIAQEVIKISHSSQVQLDKPLQSELHTSEGRASFKQSVVKADLGSLGGQLKFFSKLKLSMPGLQNHRRGVAQGSPTSPFLAGFALDHILKTTLPLGIKYVLYADDGFLYSDQPLLPSGNFTDHENEAMRILTSSLKLLTCSVHPEKSHLIKYDDHWLSDLKFVGLTYDGFTNTLSAHTRKGSRLTFNQHNLLRDIVQQSRGVTIGSPVEESHSNSLGQTWTELNYSNLKWDFLFDNRHSGWFLSRLYSGSWDLTDLNESLNRVTHLEINNRHSWLSRFTKPHMTLSNCSSLANRSLLDYLRFNRFGSPKPPSCLSIYDSPNK